MLAKAMVMRVGPNTLVLLQRLIGIGSLAHLVILCRTLQLKNITIDQTSIKITITDMMSPAAMTKTPSQLSKHALSPTNKRETSSTPDITNKGYTLPAGEAMKMSGWEPMSISDWKAREKIDESSQIRLVRLSHMRYRHPDFTSISKFLQDFGMHLVKQNEKTMWWRGYGDQAYVYVVEKGETEKYLGGAFEVESIADLEK